MDGLLIIDKPAGVTSFDVVRTLRRCCRTRKVGHAGTLDPLATGVLPVAIGQATRLLEYLMAGEKVYQATLRLGVVTDTQDAEGRIVAEADWQGVSRAALEAACAGLTGRISQVPPMYSAIKQNGQPLYRLARQGVEVEREAREVTIEAIEILRFEPPEAELRVTCSKGTYIRTLCHDLGDKLGCGAHLADLRRCRNGLFDEADSIPLAEVERLTAAGEDLPLLSPAQALADWPEIVITGDVAWRLKDGIAPKCEEVEGQAEPGQRVRIMVAGQLAAIATWPQPSDETNSPPLELLKVFPAVI